MTLSGPLIVSLGTLGYQDFVADYYIAKKCSGSSTTYVVCIEVELCKEGLLQIEI